MRNVLPSLLALSLVAGCQSVDSSTARPTASVDSILKAGRTDSRTQGDQTTSSNDWWSLWSDPAVASLARAVNENNAQIGVALARLEEARARLGLARAEGAVTVQSQATARLLGESSERTLPVPGNLVRYRDRGDSYRLPLEASWELDLWGRLRATREAASATYASQEYDLAVLRLSLTAEALGLYLTRNGLQREQAVLEETLAHRAEQVALLDVRWKAGLSPSLDLERARTEALVLETEAIDIERRLKNYDLALGLLAGLSVPYPRPGYTVVTIPRVPNDLPSVLLTRRPDLRAAEEQINARTAEIGVARAAFFPQIRLTGAAGFESPDLGALLERPAQFWQVGPSVSYTFLDGGRNRRNLEAARARAEAAHREYSVKVLSAFREFSEALQDHEGQERARASTATALISARATVTLAEERYRAGLTTYFDVLDAQRTVFSLRRTEVQVETQQALALVRTMRALGGSWE